MGPRTPSTGPQPPTHPQRAPLDALMHSNPLYGEGSGPDMITPESMLGSHSASNDVNLASVYTLQSVSGKPVSNPLFEAHDSSSRKQVTHARCPNALVLALLGHQLPIACTLLHRQQPKSAMTCKHASALCPKAPGAHTLLDAWVETQSIGFAKYLSAYANQSLHLSASNAIGHMAACRGELSAFWTDQTVRHVTTAHHPCPAYPILASPEQPPVMALNPVPFTTWWMQQPARANLLRSKSALQHQAGLHMLKRPRGPAGLQAKVFSAGCERAGGATRLQCQLPMEPRCSAQPLSPGCC